MVGARKLTRVQWSSPVRSSWARSKASRTRSCLSTASLMRCVSCGPFGLVRSRAVPHRAAQNFAGKYTFGPNVMDDAWHIEILKRKLTKHLGVLFPAMSVPSHAGIELHLADAVGSREEIAAGFDEYAPVTDGMLLTLARADAR
jgi:hypothetical protein